MDFPFFVKIRYMLRKIYTKLCNDFGVYSKQRTKKESLQLSNTIKSACLVQTEEFLRKYLPSHLYSLFQESLDKLNEDEKLDLDKYSLTLVEFLKQIPHAKFKLNAWIRGYFTRVKYSLLKKGD